MRQDCGAVWKGWEKKTPIDPMPMGVKKEFGT